ncbi:nonclathrin coat protein gamma1-COP [Bombyx mori]|uniref:Coatomer subunit gamma n=1 Tax=Bombyx mori TaxID=7091 RepID=Q9NKX3_BOMMO|nr:nonclathrin coat protein gamma1-COP [Bombyx mori]BAA93047.2 nonclathrin coat protein gamma1-COP [Bombyx mori]
MKARRDGKEEDSNVFQNLDKTTLLQEARYFNSTPVHPRKCIHILTKILYLLNQGEELTTQEATDIFFATTKLFQSKDVVLRRLVYLCIKELSPMAQDVIIVTSSLTKDMTGKDDEYRPAAIRALCSITDSTMLQAIERYMKQAIVDKNPAVGSAALVSALHLSATVPDLVRRWINEAQEAMTSDHVMVSYHALAVVAGARRNDRLSTVKLITKLARTPVRSPYTLCLQIRFAAKLAEEDPSEASEPYLEFIESCLRNKSEMVVYEAAHAIVNLRKSAKDLAQAVSVLQIFCGSSKATLRLAGARTLARLTAKHPNAVAACAVDLENLISDSNRSVATLAVTTLLATGAESSIDRLMKQISEFMSEISDEFKIVVVRAIRRLCSKYPRKHQSLAAFLAGMLRDEGGLQYKTAIAEALIALIEENPDAKETGLAHLCEFIEDCEHVTLAVRILHVLGREGPKARQPSRYIRYIYNRVILESGPVRAAAVSAVARFGASRPELLPNIRVLLSRCQLDEDDEVRDRAVFYSAILDSGNPQLINDYIINIQVPNPVLLEKSLSDYLASGDQSEPFNIAAVPTAEEPQEPKESPVEIETRKAPVVSREEQYTEQLQAIPGIEKLGPLFKSCEAIDLTEPETEYRVRCVKHIFARHLILQFECLNTLSDQLLEKVYVRLDSIPGYKISNVVPCDELPYDKQGNIFCLLEFPENPIETLGNFGATLEFVVRDCDPTTGLPDSNEGYADTYPLEEIEITCADQFRTRAATDDWEQAWERAANAAEACDTFGLTQSDVGAAASAVCEHLGMPKAAISGEAVKEIRGGGLWRAGAPVLMRARLVAAQGTVTMQLITRSPREDVATLLLAAVG